MLWKHTANDVRTVFENFPKKSHLTLRAKRATYILGAFKNTKNDPFCEFEACRQTVLPDRSISIGQKLIN